MVMHAIVLGVHLPLVRVRFAAYGFFTPLAAPTGQEANAGAWRGFPVDDEIRIVAVLALPVRVHESRQFQTRAKFDQHFLKRLAFSCWWNHGDTHRVHRTVEFRDRAVEHGHHVMAFEISGVRQNQVGEGCGFGVKGIAHHDERYLVFAVLFLVDEHLADFAGVHARVPCHVGHEQQQGIDLVRITAPGIGDHVVHQAVHRQRIFPREGFVDTDRTAVCVHEQIIRIGWPTQRHAIQWRVRLHSTRIVRRPGARRYRPWERWLVTEAAGPVDGAQ